MPSPAYSRARIRYSAGLYRRPSRRCLLRRACAARPFGPQLRGDFHRSHARVLSAPRSLWHADGRLLVPINAYAEYASTFRAGEKPSTLVSYVRNFSWSLAFSRSKIPESTLNLIASLLSASATTFAAITAAVLVLNWKSQHNLSLISKLITEVWELHGQFTSKVYVLTYTFSIETKESEYKCSYAELIEIAVPLRSKSQQLQVCKRPLNTPYEFVL